MKKWGFLVISSLCLIAGALEHNDIKSLIYWASCLISIGIASILSEFENLKK